MYSLLKPLLFQMPAERAHYFAMDALQTFCRLPGGKAITRSICGLPKNQRPVKLLGLEFPHPVGLAAGFDKDARWVDELENLGFAFIEIGTVTPKPQDGNPKPRLFRLPADKGLINRMGFNNGGVQAAADRLAQRNGQCIIGGNIGKNKVTPNQEATSDYLKCFDVLYPQVDYFVVNVSSPNTPGLRELQEREPLTRLLDSINEKNLATDAPKPVLLKIAPDLNPHQVEDIVALVKETGTSGIVLSNTTISRDGLSTPSPAVEAIGAGGLSGDPVRERSNALIRMVRELAGPDLPIIGVGGVRTAKHAQEKLDAGANLVQVYTGFIYEGPATVSNILKDLHY